MPTNDRKTNIYHKRLMSLTAIKDQFLDYLQGCIDEVGSAFFAGSSGTLGDVKIGLSNAHGGSTFDIVAGPSTATSVLAGNHVIDLTKVTGAGITHTIPFENGAGATYYVGVYFAEVEIGMEVNPRTSDPEYSAWKQTFGNVGTPTTIVDGTTYLRVNVNSITESGVSHAGRTVRVWLVDPVSPLEDVAFYEGVIVYSAPDNYVDIPYSGAAGPLGQDTGSAPPSVVLTDYRVFIEGVTWRRNVDLRAVPACAFLGTITGGTPPTFDTTDQQLLQIVSLDRAYDGIPGPGLGRKIFVDAGAVELQTATTTGDVHNAQLRLDRITGTGYFQLGLEVIGHDRSAIPLAILQILRTVDNKLLETEAVDVAGDTVTFTRGAIDLLGDNVHINGNMQLVWVRSGNAEGLYGIHSVDTLATITCHDLQTGASPAWASETALSCSILHPRMVFSNTLPVQGDELANWRGLLLTGRDGNNWPTPLLTLMPDGGYGSLIRMGTNRVKADGTADSVDCILTDVEPQDFGSPGMTLQFGQYMGAYHGETDVRACCGLDIQTMVKGADAAGKYGVNLRPMTLLDGNDSRPCTRQVGLHHEDGAEIMRWTPWGRMADTHRFVEPFDQITGVPINAYRWYKHATSAGGTLSFNDAALMLSNGDTCMIATAGSGNYDGVILEGPAMFLPRSSAGTVWRKLNFYARARPYVDNTFVLFTLGVFSGTLAAHSIAFEILAGAGVVTTWQLRSICGGVSLYGAAGPFVATGTWTNDLAWMDFWFQVNLEENLIRYWMTGMTDIASMDVKTGGLGGSDWLDLRAQPHVGVQQNGSTGGRILEVDHVEVWDELVLAGVKE
jgi:hypothetical protein